MTDATDHSGESIEPLPSIPDIALQIVNPRTEDGRCFSAENRDLIRMGLLEAFPAADVRRVCRGEADPDNMSLVIAIWTRSRPLTRRDNDAARDDGVLAASLHTPASGFAIRVNSSYLRRELHEGFARVPKDYDSDGSTYPGSDRHIHLSGTNLTMVAPDKVVTTIFGYDSAPTPDVSFKIVITDRLSTVRSTPSVDVVTKVETIKDRGDVVLA